MFRLISNSGLHAGFTDTEVGEEYKHTGVQTAITEIKTVFIRYATCQRSNRLISPHSLLLHS